MIIISFRVLNDHPQGQIEFEKLVRNAGIGFAALLASDTTDRTENANPDKWNSRNDVQRSLEVL